MMSDIRRLAISCESSVAAKQTIEMKYQAYRWRLRGSKLYRRVFVMSDIRRLAISCESSVAA